MWNAACQIGERTRFKIMVEIWIFHNSWDSALASLAKIHEAFMEYSVDERHITIYKIVVIKTSKISLT